jgi:phenol 2-monooxygenase (NADPH)
MSHIDRYDKAEQAIYGRATTLFPRTLEMLDQLDLLDEMAQMGVIARSSVAFKNGKKVTTRGWNVVFTEMGGTYLDYVLNLRQQFSEGIFRDAYERFNVKVHAGWTLKGLVVDENPNNGYRVTSTIEEITTKSTKLIKR